MEVSVVTSKGQVVIPARLRKKYGIKIGTKIQFAEENGEIIMFPLTEKIIEQNIGFLETKGSLLKKYLSTKQCL